MEQPPGFVTQGESGLVCRLCRSLYGIKQSPRAWFSRFSSMVQEFSMTQSTSDHPVFYHHTSSGQCIYLIVYVDDIVITGSDQGGIRKLKQHLFSHFQTKDLEKLKYFLDIEIAQSKSGVVMSQRKYVLDILEETGMQDYKPVDTPMNPNVKLIPGQGQPLRDPGRYQRLVGRLNYLTITQSDISFPVSIVVKGTRRIKAQRPPGALRRKMHLRHKLFYVKRTYITYVFFLSIKSKQYIDKKRTQKYTGSEQKGLQHRQRRKTRNHQKTTYSPSK